MADIGIWPGAAVVSSAGEGAGRQMQGIYTCNPMRFKLGIFALFSLCWIFPPCSGALAHFFGTFCLWVRSFLFQASFNGVLHCGSLVHFFLRHGIPRPEDCIKAA